MTDLPASLKTPKDEKFTGEVWALLIAGSYGYGNYRHQADVAHAYQVLAAGGVPDDHIVVMVYDDIASSIENPHKGQIFNRPGGPNVYKGMPKDYTGENVNVDTFLAVLNGKEDVPVALGSTGKTIKSKANDRVFVYYSDHGAPGILGMPTGDFLYADKLVKTLHKKAAENGFAEMVMYIEACESGSMFEGTLDDSLKIYAVTAANAAESSWGAYCPGQTPGPPPEFGTCLGDLFSISFLENDDATDLVKETLEQQFLLVRNRTSNNGTYEQGSHVLQFGSLAIDDEPVGDYQGEADTDMMQRVRSGCSRRAWGACASGRRTCCRCAGRCSAPARPQPARLLKPSCRRLSQSVRQSTPACVARWPGS
jgi:legumain